MEDDILNTLHHQNPDEAAHEIDYFSPSPTENEEIADYA
jgi:hypothetical protein